jgi:DNA processing protein
MPLIDFHIDALEAMKKYPKELHYRGNLELLKAPKVSIVGTRRPQNYTKVQTTQLAQALSKRGVVIVSGGAMGVDAIAHTGATPANTISVYASGIDIRYPAVNRELLATIEAQGLALSQFAPSFKATAWSFVLRNELVVALGDILIVAQADLESGSLRSVEFALEMGKKIFVLPHRIGESKGTNKLLLEGKAEAIYNIEAFASQFGVAVESAIVKDDFFYFCQSFPTLEEAVSRFGERVYEAEFDGVITIENGMVYLA